MSEEEYRAWEIDHGCDDGVRREKTDMKNVMIDESKVNRLCGNGGKKTEGMCS